MLTALFARSIGTPQAELDAMRTSISIAQDAAPSPPPPVLLQISDDSSDSDSSTSTSVSSKNGGGGAAGGIGMSPVLGRERGGVQERGRGLRRGRGQERTLALAKNQRISCSAKERHKDVHFSRSPWLDERIAEKRLQSCSGRQLLRLTKTGDQSRTTGHKRDK